MLGSLELGRGLGSWLGLALALFAIGHVFQAKEIADLAIKKQAE